VLDLTNAAKLQIGIDDLRRLAQRSVFSSGGHRAILVNSDLASGFARMFVIFRETLGEKEFASSPIWTMRSIGFFAERRARAKLLRATNMAHYPR
jgi:hypothetical protein